MELKLALFEPAKTSDWNSAKISAGAIVNSLAGMYVEAETGGRIFATIDIAD